MTNKRITKMLLCLSMALGLFTSCYEDKGNYDYISEDDAAGVVLGSMEEATVKANDVLKIEPQMKEIISPIFGTLFLVELIM